MLFFCIFLILGLSFARPNSKDDFFVFGDDIATEFDLPVDLDELEEKANNNSENVIPIIVNSNNSKLFLGNATSSGIWSHIEKIDYNGDIYSDILVSGKDDSGNYFPFVLHGFKPNKSISQRNETSSETNETSSETSSETNDFRYGSNSARMTSFYLNFGTTNYSSEIARNAGDFNGDGYEDIIFGFPNLQVNGNDRAGLVIVHFSNNRDSSIVDLSEARNRNVRLYTGVAGNLVGLSVSSVGDLNNDSKSDVAVTLGNTLGTYIVFGRNIPGEIVIQSSFSQFGFRIYDSSFTPSSIELYSLGDFDGDGFNDFIYADPSANGESGSNNGVAYIVFGRTSFSSPVNLSSVNNNILKVEGHDGVRLGTSVLTMVDYNCDGKKDILLGTNSTTNTYINIIFGIERSDSEQFVQNALNLTQLLHNSGVVSLSSFNPAKTHLCDGVIIGLPDYSIPINTSENSENSNNSIMQNLNGLAIVSYGHPGLKNSTFPVPVLLDKLVHAGDDVGFAQGVSNVGDFDGDGVEDIVISTPTYQIEENSVGGFYLMTLSKLPRNFTGNVTISISKITQSLLFFVVLFISYL